ncbi:MAG TPA: hypothetical protein VFQ51_19245 [Vicinamibacteria bacterium]|nr:hypothetical protein [Vicinamibacteria bacterium]
MDDARIRDLTNEVLAALDRSPDARAAQSLEARVAALEAAVARLTAGPVAVAAPAPPSVRGHVSLTVLDAPQGGERCVLEPDRPCTNSGACRTFGH